MKQALLIITLLLFLSISCTENASVEKEYIQNPEEKTKALEKEFQESKGKLFRKAFLKIQKHRKKILRIILQ